MRFVQGDVDAGLIVCGTDAEVAEAALRVAGIGDRELAKTWSPVVQYTVEDVRTTIGALAFVVSGGFESRHIGSYLPSLAWLQTWRAGVYLSLVAVQLVLQFTEAGMLQESACGWNHKLRDTKTSLRGH